MTNLQAHCPICDGEVSLPQNVEVSEILVCPGCKNRIVVSRANEGNFVLEKAPEVEEDWGQ